LFLAGVFDPGPDLTPIPTFEITSTDAAVQEQISGARQRLESNPYDPEINGLLGMLYEIYQYPEAARICYERAVALSPGVFRWKYYQARIEYDVGNLEATSGLLTESLKINPRYSPAIALLGKVYLELGRLDDAQKTLNSALTYNQQSVSALLGLGNTLARKGEHDKAIEQYQKALKIAPRHAPLHYALGLSYRAIGATDRAVQHLETAQDGSPDNPDSDPLVAQLYEHEVGINAIYRKATTKLNAHQYDEAIVMLRQVTGQQPDHFGAHGSLGMALLLSNRPREALSEFEKAIALNPNNIDFLRPYALLLYRANRFDEAEAALQRVLELGGDHHDDHQILGVTLLRLERHDEAILQFELALKRNPSSVEARRALTQMLKMQAGRAASDEAALPYLGSLAELAPGDPLSWTMLGGALERTGDLEGAIEAIEKALAINPDLTEVIERRDALRNQIERSER
jgi:tetratricopeptide (TPR) repeat protein